jgi:intracellular multiplication protein IcmG
MGLSLPWLAGIVIALAGTGWYLFWPASPASNAGQLAFGQPAGFHAVQPVQATAVQTGGLSIPATAVSPDVAPGSSVPEEVVKMIREGRDYEAANREAISRLSDTVRAQSVALADLQTQGRAENAAMANKLTVLETRQSSPVSHDGKSVRQTARRSALSGMQLESVQDGMAWVSWQGRTWAVQPGQRLGSVTIIDVNAGNREVVTSSGVLR